MSRTLAAMPLRLWQIVPDLATVDALAEPWQQLYAHSTVVATLVLFGHVGGLMVAGALTFSTESGALRLDPNQRVHDLSHGRRHLERVHRRAPRNRIRLLEDRLRQSALRRHSRLGEIDR